MLTERTRRILEAYKTMGKRHTDKDIDILSAAAKGIGPQFAFNKLVNAAEDFFATVMLPYETFTFNEPCNRCPGYEIYAIHNNEIAVMADATIDKRRQISTKGLNTLNIYDAMIKYCNNEGVSRIDFKTNNVGNII